MNWSFEAIGEVPIESNIDLKSNDVSFKPKVMTNSDKFVKKKKPKKPLDNSDSMITPGAKGKCGDIIVPEIKSLTPIPSTGAK
jgi:hypothetical protein